MTTQDTVKENEMASMKNDEWEALASEFPRAQALQAQLDNEIERLSAKLFAWISAQLPPGTVIDLRHRTKRSDSAPLPMHLRCVEVLVGNKRGTHIFRIEAIHRVVVNPRYPERSRWVAKATPISETTGKDMSGRAGNTKGFMGQDLQLIGNFNVELDI